MSRKQAVLLSFLVIVPILVVISYLTFGEMVSLLPGSGLHSSMPFVESILFLLMIQGGLYIAMILAVIGSVKLSRTLLIAASFVFLFESIPFVFDGLFVLTLLLAFYFLWMSRNPRYLLEKMNKAI